MGLKPFRSNFFIFFESRKFWENIIFFERGVREPKGREDRCDKKESRQRQWDPLCQWVNRSTGLVNAPNMNYFSQNTLFFILQLCLAPFFNFSPLSDLKYNLPQISGKIGFFRKNIEFFGFFAKKSVIFPNFLPTFFLPIFLVKIVSMPPENRFFGEKSTEESDFLFIGCYP